MRAIVLAALALLCVAPAAAQSPLCLTRVGMLDHLERNYPGVNLLFSARDAATDNAYEIWVQPNDRWFLIVQDTHSDGNGTCILDAGNDAKLMKSGHVSPTMIRRMERDRELMD